MEFFTPSNFNICHFEGTIYLKSEYVNITVTADTTKLPQFSMQATIHGSILSTSPDRIAKMCSFQSEIV